MLEAKDRHARALFDGIAGSYDSPAALLSFGMYGRWRGALLRMVDPEPGARALDVATGTGQIARGLERRAATVVGLDQSLGMLAAARARSARPLVGGSGVALPFPDGAFDVVTFSYLLRYVTDPAATLHELVRVLRPGGRIGSVEFGRPSGLAGLGWGLYARRVFPMLCRPFGAGWREVGSFLPGSIEAWTQTWPLPRQEAAWRDAGLVGVRTRALTFGAGVVMVARKDGHAA